MARTAEAFAPAKVNLALHVTGQRPDGYHLLDSLVVFADVGDRITVTEAVETSLTVLGPMAKGVPADASNLVVKAASLLGVTAQITLEKHLPAAAGIGGGSSDAAATLRALCVLFDMPLPNAERALSLGADVPVCLRSGWARMSGIGEVVTPLENGVEWPMILINPRVEVPTPTVFKALKEKNNPPMKTPFPDWQNADDARVWLQNERNDLEAPAIAAQPVIGAAIEALRASQNCTLARMSGSGATCFGIYPTKIARDDALRVLQSAHPNWWVTATQTIAA